MKLYTIGFTQKTAEEFFGLLDQAGVAKIVDTRINNVSQLAGFAKGKDLEFFARRILNIDYEHDVSYAPTKEMLSEYRKGGVPWEEYEQTYIALLEQREILSDLNIEKLENACLLCSEHEPDFCHRRLLAEYIQSAYPEVEIIHLV